MGIADIHRQFTSKLEGTDIKLAKVVMTYLEGGAIQRFEFRVSKNKGATTTIPVECNSAAAIPEVIESAAEQAKAWAEAQQ